MSVPEENTYILDPNAPIEVQRLLAQGAYLNRWMDEPLAEQSERERFKRILDVACGPGVWCRVAASAFPDASVVGIDISEKSIEYAQMKARMRQLTNCTFEQMNVLKPLIFEDNSFDLVNARMMHGFLNVEQWVPLLEECFRVLRPGGTIRLTEDEMPFSNAPAFEKLSLMSSQALNAIGKGFSPDGRRIGIMIELTRLLRRAGYVDIQHVLHPLDIGADARDHQVVVDDLKSAYTQAKSFLIQYAGSSQQEQDVLIEQMLQEMDEPDFSAFWLFITAWGKKPE